MSHLVFYTFAIFTLGSALAVVSLKNTARALFLFFFVLFGMAGLFIFSLADFIAITQIMVYVGGVLILMIFAFMLSNKELLASLQDSSTRIFSVPNWQSLILALGFFIVMGYGALEWLQEEPRWIIENRKSGAILHPTDNNIEQLGVRFMTKYLLPFETVSIFLLAALIGAAHLSRKGVQDD